ncbi:hypothetical protein RUM43_014445 [Polyplax serrata]|uniref:Uncharacterized protein n=1 Tax=Polyplax serrata TaxID=468196 RepID=A0AAN8P1G1_POLSC
MNNQLGSFEETCQCTDFGALCNCPGETSYPSDGDLKGALSNQYEGPMKNWTDFSLPGNDTELDTYFFYERFLQPECMR